MNVPHTRSRNRLRTLAILVHRYVGLVIATFLVLAGLTGSLLAFNHELDAALSPGLFVAEAPPAGARPLSPFQLRAALLGQLPDGMHLEWVPLRHEPGHNAQLWASAEAQGADVDNQYFVDPYTGALRGSRHWGDLGQGLKNLMPFVYRLHYSLALDDVGTALFGVVALLWTLDCFVGAYLTLPQRRSAAAVATKARTKSWLARWKPAWLLRGGQLFSWVFTWHRASGLWLWAMLLVFAWSAVGLNLAPVYKPVTAALFGLRDSHDALPVLDPPRLQPRLDFEPAFARGQALLTEHAETRGFELHEPEWFGYDPEHGAYFYEVRSSRDVSRYGDTGVWFDGDSGAPITYVVPTGEVAGNTLTTWINALHFAAFEAGGLLYRVFVSVFGLAVALLGASGAWIWWRKRSARRVRSGRRSAPAVAPTEPRVRTAS